MLLLLLLILHRCVSDARRLVRQDGTVRSQRDAELISPAASSRVSAGGEALA